MPAQGASRQRSWRFSFRLSFYLREVWFPTFSRRRVTVSGRHRRVLAGTLQRAANGEIVETEADVGVLRYPDSATAAEKPLSRKDHESFPSWTSSVRPRSPALEPVVAREEVASAPNDDLGVHDARGRGPPLPTGHSR